MSAQDLFSWVDEAEAAKHVEATEAARAEAARACLRAPHGQVRIREARLRAATADALRAELALAEIQRRAGQP